VPYNVTYDGQSHSATGTAIGVGGVNLNGDLSFLSPHTNAGVYTSDWWSFVDPIGNYATEGGPMTDTITPATPTFSDLTASQSIVYGTSVISVSGTLSAGPVSPLDGENVIVSVDGENISATLIAGTFSVPVPTGTIPVVGSPWTISYSYAGDNNFNPATDTSTSLAVTPATATISVNPIAGLVYTGLPQETASYSAIGVNGALPNSDFTDYTVHTNAGTVTDSWSFVDPTGNYAPANGTVTDTINQAPLTISAKDVNSVYADGTTLNETTGFNATGLQNGETIGNVVLTTNATLSGSGNWNVGTWTITPSDATGGTFNPSNYNIVYDATFSTDVLTVTPKALTITATSASKVYGTTATIAYTAPGLVSGDHVTVTETSAGAAPIAPVGSYPIDVTASGSDLGDYNVTYVNGKLTVTKAALTITATSASKIYGTTATLAYTETGLVMVNGDTINSVTETSNGAAATAAVGSYAIDISAAVGTGLSNYTIKYIDGTLTVTKASLTITATSASKVYGTTVPLAYTETGLVNSDTINSVTETSSGTSTTAAVGSYAIDISAAVGTGLSNYTIKYIDGTLTVTPATAVVTVTGYDVTYKGASYTATGSVNGVFGSLPTSDLNLTGTTHTNAGPAANGFAYNDSWTFTNPNYVSQAGTVTDVIQQAQATIHVTGYDVTYNGLAHSATVTATGVNSANLNSDLTISSTHTNAGPAANGFAYSDSWSFVDPNGNYVPQYGTMTDVIDQAILTITAENETMVAGGTVPTLAVTYKGFVDGQTASVLSTPVVVSYTGSQTVVGVHADSIVPSGATDSNYAISYVDGTMTVTKKPVSG